MLSMLKAYAVASGTAVAASVSQQSWLQCLLGSQSRDTRDESEDIGREGERSEYRYRHQGRRFVSQKTGR